MPLPPIVACGGIITAYVKMVNTDSAATVLIKLLLDKLMASEIVQTFKFYTEISLIKM